MLTIGEEMRARREEMRREGRRLWRWVRVIFWLAATLTFAGIAALAFLGGALWRWLS